MSSNFKEFFYVLEALKKPNFEVFVDLDGVLCDFVAQTEKMTGQSPDYWDSRGGDPLMWGKIAEHGEKFWSEMPWVHGSQEFWKYLTKFTKPKILSAPPRRIDEAKRGKINWVKHNLGNQYEVILARASEKQNYSGENKILIDDLEKI